MSENKTRYPPTYPPLPPYFIQTVRVSNTRGFLSFATSGRDTRTTQLFINFEVSIYVQCVFMGVPVYRCVLVSACVFSLCVCVQSVCLSVCVLVRKCNIMIEHATTTTA